MKKVVKVALTWFNSLDDVKQARILSEVFNSKDYIDFLASHKDVNIENLPYCYLKQFLANRFKTSTVSGARPAKAKYGRDKLQPIKVWMPNGMFGPSRYGSYAPLGVKVECTELVRPFIMKKREQKMVKEWDKAKSLLRSSPIGDSSNYIAPWLDYDPKLSDEQDVYFVLDKCQKLVKIGISKDIPNRIVSIKTQYNTGKLKVVAIISGGGPSTEEALHERFDHIRLKQTGKGREWFHQTEEMDRFIDELNSYAIKSIFLESASIL